MLTVALLGGGAAARPAGLRPGTPGEQSIRLEAPALADVAVGQGGRVEVVLFALGAWSRDALTAVYLPGFDAGPADFRTFVLPGLTRAVARGALPPLVVAVVDGRNALGGGFYAGYWTKLLARRLPEALRAQGLSRKPVLVGHSMGGYGALRVAREAPGAYARVVALNPVTGLPSVAGREVVARAAALLAHGAGPAAWAEHPSQEEFRVRLFWAAVAAFAPRLGGWGNALDGEELSASARAALEEALAPAPGRCGAEVALVAGERDALVPVAHVRALASSLEEGCPGRRVSLRVHGGSHVSELPEDVVRALSAPSPSAPRSRAAAPRPEGR